MTDGGTRTCFVVMPITVPAHLVDRYDKRTDHFTKIYDKLVVPAVERAGLTAIGPARSGTENIQAAIINDLQGADLVLADLSGLNPNVFLELGIRSALDKPVCLVWDGHDALPFDAGTLNTHRYDPHPAYELNAEIDTMAAFIETTMDKTDGRNELWKYFGSASKKLPVAELEPEDASLHAKVDRLADLIENRLVSLTPRGPQITDRRLIAVRDAVGLELEMAGPAGVHGSMIRAICQSYLGEAYPDFIGSGTLSGRLNGLGLDIRTNSSGQFFLGSPVESSV